MKEGRVIEKSGQELKFVLLCELCVLVHTKNIVNIFTIPLHNDAEMYH